MGELEKAGSWKLEASCELELESEDELEKFSNFVNFWELENI